MVYWPGRSGFPPEGDVTPKEGGPRWDATRGDATRGDATMGYTTRETAPAAGTGAARGSVSCYAWGPDYHAALGGKLAALAQWLHTRCGGRGRWEGWRAGRGMARDQGPTLDWGVIGVNPPPPPPRGLSPGGEGRGAPYAVGSRQSKHA